MQEQYHDINDFENLNDNLVDVEYMGDQIEEGQGEASNLYGGFIQQPLPKTF